VRPGDAADNPVDLVIVGAGVVGLAHAVEGARQGRSVLVLERDDRAVGASVRNFGHGCITAQAGPALAYAQRARATWVDLAAAAGFPLVEAGTAVVARADDEMAVLEQLADRRGDDVRLLDRAALLELAPVGDEAVVGGAHLRTDLRVDPRVAVGAIAAWLQDQPGAEVRFGTQVQTVEPGLVRTAARPVHARDVVVCVGHDIDRFFPDAAASAGVRRCGLHMLAVDSPGDERFDPAVLTGLSMLRYAGMAECPAAAAVRTRFAAERPELLDAAVNLMFTQRPDGTLLIGDTHAYGRTLDPFRDEALDQLLLGEIARLLGRPQLVVRQRWYGEYASGDDDFLVAEPMPGVRAVSVTTGIGMTTAFGLAPAVLDGSHAAVVT
jgi:FAD dependent oxidoreductase TIGR03364